MSDEIELTLCENGPLLLPGNATVVMAGASRPAPGNGRVAVCRCGGTGNPPFCDGTHSRNDFAAPGGTLNYRPASDS